MPEVIETKRYWSNGRGGMGGVEAKVIDVTVGLPGDHKPGFKVFVTAGFGSALSATVRH